MSDYLYCISRPEHKGLIELHTSYDDPRQDTPEALQRRRALGRFTLEWTLPVVDKRLSEAALRKTLKKHRDSRQKNMFACDPMDARGEAIKVTTLRPESNKRQKPSLLRRIIRAA